MRSVRWRSRCSTAIHSECNSTDGDNHDPTGNRNQSPITTGAAEHGLMDLYVSGDCLKSQDQSAEHAEKATFALWARPELHGNRNRRIELVGLVPTP